MKTTFLTLLLLLILNICNAQLVQAVNKNYEKTYKKTEKKVTINDTTYYTAHHKLLKIDNVIDPSAAAYHQQTCINEIKKLNTELNNVVSNGKRNVENKTKLSENEINDIATKLNQQIKDYKKARDYFGAINSLDGSPKLSRRVLPLRSITQAQRFYLESEDGEKKISFIKDLTYQNNLDGSNTMSSSILTAVLPLWKMPLKLNIASTITQNNDTIVQNKIADKLARGGLFNVGLTYTLFYSNWKYIDNNSVVIYMPIETRFHIDDVKNKSNLSDSFFYTEMSSSLFLSFDLLQDKDNNNSATLFLVGKWSYFNGGAKFTEKLTENKFSLLQLNTGIKIANKYTISVNIPMGSSSKSFFNNQTATLGLVFDTGN